VVLVSRAWLSGSPLSAWLPFAAAITAGAAVIFLGGLTETVKPPAAARGKS